MVTRSPPKSNAERQRDFRERHPGYYARLQAKRRAQERAMATLWGALISPPPLALPAPVEMPIIPGMNTIEAMPTPAPLPIELQL
jgi:hypothetical protein